MLVDGPQDGIAPRRQFGEPCIGLVGGFLSAGQCFGGGLQCHGGLGPDLGVRALAGLQQ